MVLFANICGWIGAILVLVAYFMVSSGKSHSNSVKFQSLNIIGALLLVVYTFDCAAYASMIVNTIWIFIGLASFKKIYLSQKNTQHHNS